MANEQATPLTEREIESFRHQLNSETLIRFLATVDALAGKMRGMVPRCVGCAPGEPLDKWGHASGCYQGQILYATDREMREGRQRVIDLTAEVKALTAERDDLKAKLNTPEIHDFAEAVVLEAAHQRERWAADHDAGKTDADWFWLIGYLAGKALHNPNGDHDKRLHRIITIAAAACNWHAAVSGSDTRMRPGIDDAQLRTVLG